MEENLSNLAAKMQQRGQNQGGSFELVKERSWSEKNVTSDGIADMNMPMYIARPALAPGQQIGHMSGVEYRNSLTTAPNGDNGDDVDIFRPRGKRTRPSTPAVLTHQLFATST
eukprot:4982312-Pyramimonas_sp.AAC.1